MIRRGLFHLAFNVRLGPLQPYVLGLALGRMPERITDWDEETWQERQRVGALEGKK